MIGKNTKKNHLQSRSVNMKYTLDTNIIINGCINDNNCQTLAKRFIKENVDGDCFLTPQVKREINHLLSRFTMILEMIIDLTKKESISPRLAYEKLKSNFSKIFKNKLDGYFSNLVSYLESNKKTNVDSLQNKFISFISLFTNRTINIQPNEENVKKNYDKIKQYKKDIFRKKLVFDRDDLVIICELKLFNDLSAEKVILYTKNLKDFNYKSKLWKKELNFIEIKKP